MAPLGEHQMRVGVFSVRPAPVDGQRIGQPLPGAHPLGELACELPPLLLAQLLGKRELDLAVQPPVGAFVFVCRLPVFSVVVLCPLRHVSGLFVLQFLTILLVAPFALNVIALGAGRLPPGAGTETSFKMIDCHASMSLLLILSTPFHKVKRNSAPSLPFGYRHHRRHPANNCSIVLPMLPSPPAMEPQEELEQLLARKTTLKQELKARKKELQDAQRRQRANLQKQIRRAQARLSSAERKQRTRRLILMGSYLEHVTGDDPDKRDSLMKGLEGFLERDRDRGLFDLPPNKEISDGNSG